MQEDILEKLKNSGQGHLVQHYHTIQDAALKENFLSQLKKVDIKQVTQLYDEVYLHHKNKEQETKQVKMSVPEHIVDRQQIKAMEAEFDRIGMEAVAKGEIGVCIMSGGQGSRLGFDHPKGMFNLELESKCTLFQFFVRRLLRLNEIAKKQFPDSKWQINNMVKLYIMTSEMNHNQIENFFKEHNYFGYSSQAIFFFPQGGIPALDYKGKVMIESQGNLSLAPGGNGAIYVEMKERGALKHMRKCGVKYTYIISVDNVLAKLGDPTCAGFMIKNGFDIVSTYVKKAYPDEKVGIHVLVDNKVNVCEYTQVPKEVREARDKNGQLLYVHGNRATIFISTDFLQKITTSEEIVQKINRKYHLAEKKIKCYDPATKESHKPEHDNNGMKFQLFYFDVFEECDKFGLFETIREEQFAPVKNAEGVDSPASARKLLRDLHTKWVKEAGITLEGEGYVEIDPRVSYNGQGIGEYVRNKYGDKLKVPAYIN